MKCKNKQKMDGVKRWFGRRIYDYLCERVYGGGFKVCPNCLERYPAYRDERRGSISTWDGFIPQDDDPEKVRKICMRCRKWTYDPIYWDTFGWVCKGKTERISCENLAEGWGSVRGKSRKEIDARALWYLLHLGYYTKKATKMKTVGDVEILVEAGLL